MLLQILRTEKKKSRFYDVSNLSDGNGELEQASAIVLTSFLITIRSFDN
jgi:hypothetical protein